MILVRKLLISLRCANWKVYAWTICLIYTILLTASETKFIYDVRKDFDLLPPTVIYYATALMGLYKIFVILYFRKKIDKMHVTIAERFLDLINVRDGISKKVNLRLTMIDKAIVIGVSMTLMVCLFAVIHPPANFPEGRRPLPDIVWLPFDANPSPLHEVLYVAIGIGQHLIVVGLLAYDLIFLYFTQSLSVQFVILKELLRNVCEVPDVNDNDKWNSVLYQEVINKRINDCIKHHILLIQFYKDLKDMFSLSLFFQFLLSIILTTFVGFMLKLGSMDTVQKVTLLVSVGAIGLEILQIALNGGELEYQSQTVSCAVYCSRWYFGKKAFRKAINILQMNSQTPLRISAAGLTYVNNELIVSIYKTVFSLLTLIDTMVEAV